MNSEAENIRLRIRETRTALTEKIGHLETHMETNIQAAAASVNAAAETVAQTVHAVQDSIIHTKERIANSVDIPRHVERHPWPMAAGAAAVGYIGTMYLRRRLGGHVPPYERGRAQPVAAARPVPTEPRQVPYQEVAAISATPSGPRFATRMGEVFHDEILLVKGLALGTLFGIIRDIATNSAPESLNKSLEEAINHLTLKLGGQPIRGRVLPLRTNRRSTDTAPFRADAPSPDADDVEQQ